MALIGDKEDGELRRYRIDCAHNMIRVAATYDVYILKILVSVLILDTYSRVHACTHTHTHIHKCTHSLTYPAIQKQWAVIISPDFFTRTQAWWALSGLTWLD